MSNTQRKTVSNEIKVEN